MRLPAYAGPAAHLRMRQAPGRKLGGYAGVRNVPLVRPGREFDHRLPGGEHFEQSDLGLVQPGSGASRPSGPSDESNVAQALGCSGGHGDLGTTWHLRRQPEEVRGIQAGRSHARTWGEFLDEGVGGRGSHPQGRLRAPPVQTTANPTQLPAVNETRPAGAAWSTVIPPAR